MPWPRKSLAIALFFLSSPWVNADTITVNTTTDDNADNSLCSLREAITYFNRGKPAGGYQGCVAPGSDSFSVIKVPADAEPYVIGNLGHILISTSVNISGDGAKGEEVTTIQVQGAHRAFIVNFNPSYEAPACATTDCSPDVDPALAPAPELAPGSDTDDSMMPYADLTTDAVGDYLTYIQLPELTGTIPVPPGNHVNGQSYVVRIYDNPKGDNAEPVLLASQKITPPDPTSPAPWSIRSRSALAAGIHFLTYTVETVDSASATVPGGEETPHSEQLTLAIYPLDERPVVSLNGVVVKGGGVACTTAPAVTCATSADDSVSKVNDPADTANYDRYALTYRNIVSDTSGNGGVIFNSENLVLSDSILQDGDAQGMGGGIYVTNDGGIQLRGVEVRDNESASGAAVYVAHNSLKIESSLFAGNKRKGVAGTGSIVEVGSATLVRGFSASSIQSSTFSGNTGIALSLRDNTAASTPPSVLLENLTVVLNTGGGIDFNGTDVEIRNSIIAGNQDPSAAAGIYIDCLNSGSAVITYSLIVTGDGCPPDTVPSTNGNQTISDSGNETLMATLDADDRCNSPTGMLCPLAEHGGSTLVHMPRLLPGFATIAESRVINRAGPNCLALDQRGEQRSYYACDIGAVEAQEVASDSFTSSGGSIRFGNRYEQFLGDGLADEELLPTGQCPPGVLRADGNTYPPTQWADSSWADLPTLPDEPPIVANSYNPLEPGCPWLVKAPSRGTVAFERFDPVAGVLMPVGQGYYTYAPSFYFHGFDRFEMRVVTTLSKTNSLINDRSRLVRATVIVEPNTEMTSEKLGGAIDAWGLLLLGIIGLGWSGRRQS